MPYKQPPDNSIDGAGGLENYIDNLFEKRGKPYTFSRDVEPLFRMKRLSWSARGRQIDIAGTTFKTWQERYNREHETDSH